MHRSIFCIIGASLSNRLCHQSLEILGLQLYEEAGTYKSSITVSEVHPGLSGVRIDMPKDRSKLLFELWEGRHGGVPVCVCVCVCVCPSNPSSLRDVSEILGLLQDSTHLVYRFGLNTTDCCLQQASSNPPADPSIRLTYFQIVP